MSNPEWFDGTHLIRRVEGTSRLESAMADPQGNRISDFALIKGRELWGECIGFVRRCESIKRKEAAMAEKVLEGFQ